MVYNPISNSIYQTFYIHWIFCSSYRVVSRDTDQVMQQWAIVNEFSSISFVVLFSLISSGFPSQKVGTLSGIKSRRLFQSPSLLCDYRPCFCSFFVGIGRVFFHFDWSQQFSKQQPRPEQSSKTASVSCLIQIQAQVSPNNKRAKIGLNMQGSFFAFLCQCCNGGFVAPAMLKQRSSKLIAPSRAKKLTHLLANCFVSTVNIRLYRHEIHFVYHFPNHNRDSLSRSKSGFNFQLGLELNHCV